MEQKYAHIVTDAAQLEKLTQNIALAEQAELDIQAYKAKTEALWAEIDRGRVEAEQAAKAEAEGKLSKKELRRLKRPARIYNGLGVAFIAASLLIMVGLIALRPPRWGVFVWR